MIARAVVGGICSNISLKRLRADGLVSRLRGDTRITSRLLARKGNALATDNSFSS